MKTVLLFLVIALTASLLQAQSQYTVEQSQENIKRLWASTSVNYVDMRALDASESKIGEARKKVKFQGEYYFSTYGKITNYRWCRLRVGPVRGSSKKERKENIKQLKVIARSTVPSNYKLRIITVEEAGNSVVSKLDRHYESYEYFYVYHHPEDELLIEPKHKLMVLMWGKKYDHCIGTFTDRFTEEGKPFTESKFDLTQFIESFKIALENESNYFSDLAGQVEGRSLPIRHGRVKFRSKLSILGEEKPSILVTENAFEIQSKDGIQSRSLKEHQSNVEKIVGAIREILGNDFKFERTKKASIFSNNELKIRVEEEKRVVSEHSEYGLFNIRLSIKKSTEGEQDPILEKIRLCLDLSPKFFNCDSPDYCFFLIHPNGREYLCINQMNDGCWRVDHVPLNGLEMRYEGSSGDAYIGKERSFKVDYGSFEFVGGGFHRYNYIWSPSGFAIEADTSYYIEQLDERRFSFEQSSQEEIDNLSAYIKRIVPNIICDGGEYNELSALEQEKQYEARKKADARKRTLSAETSASMSGYSLIASGNEHTSKSIMVETQSSVVTFYVGTYSESAAFSLSYYNKKITGKTSWVEGETQYSADTFEETELDESFVLLPKSERPGFLSSYINVYKFSVNLSQINGNSGSYLFPFDIIQHLGTGGFDYFVL